MTNTLKLGIILLAIYGALVLMNAGFYAWWSDDFSELHRAVIRFAGVILIIYGLIKRANWAWWMAIVGTGSLSILGGLAATLVLSNNNIFANRPYPTIEMVFIFLLIGILALAFFALLMPSTRKEIIKTGTA